MLNQILNKFNLNRRDLLEILIGTAIMAFTLVNIHQQSKITEGGVIGLTLFAYRVFGLDPAFISPLLDISCFLLATSIFGKNFFFKTSMSAIVFAIMYKVFMYIGPVLPSLEQAPLLASLLGGIGIGFGCGLVVSKGLASGGDDSLALMISRKLNVKLSYAYLIMDFIVLGLSLIYIPVTRIVFSILTTLVSSFTLGQFEVNIKPKRNTVRPAATAELKI